MKAPIKTTALGTRPSHREIKHRPATGEARVKRFNSLIESIGTYLPPEIRSSDEVVANCSRRVPIPLEFMTGIQNRHCAGKDEFSRDLAAKALEDCLNQSKYSVADIDLIVCCNISKFDEPGHQASVEPTTAMALKHQFGFGDATIAFDVNNACAGMFTGIYLVNSLIRSGSIRRGLVISGEYITHLTATAQEEIKGLRDLLFACLTLGDSGAALLLDRTDNLRIGFQDIDLFTVSEYSDLCIGEPAFRPRGGAVMKTDSRAMAKHGIYHTVRNNREVMDKNGWTAKTTDHLITHQVAAKITERIRRDLNKLSSNDQFEPEKLIQTVQRTGNTSSTTHTIALHQGLKDGTIGDHDRTLFSVSASGLTVGTALYQFDDLPERLRRMKKDGSYPAKQEPESRARKQGIEKALVAIDSLSIAPADDHLDSRQTAARAGQACIDKSGYDANDIDLLISTGVYKSGFVDEPSNAALIARELKINTDFSEDDYTRKTFAFDINAGSTGWLHAVYLAQEQVRANAVSRVLVTASEADENKQSEGLDPLNLSELGTATLLHPTRGGEGFSNFYFETHDVFLDAFRSHADASAEEPCVRHETAPHYETRLLRCLETSLHRYMSTLGDIGFTDFDYIVGPQISGQFDSRLAEFLKLKGVDDRLVRYQGSDKNLFTSSVACGLSTIINGDSNRAGKKALLLSAGSGIQIASAIYHF